jgi:hypothetical protein
MLHGKDRSMARRNGFTVVQLLVILALLLMLLGFLMAALTGVRQAAGRVEGLNNLKQIGLAAHNFHDVYKAFPPAVDNQSGPVHYHLLPFIEQTPLFQQAGGQVWNKGVNTFPVQVYLDVNDPSAPTGNKFNDWLATSNYAANWLVFQTGGKGILTITDGTSNTLMFTQRYQVCNGTPTAWGYPALYTWAPIFGYYNQGRFQHRPKQADCDPTLPQSIAEGGIQTLFCDASARVISDAASPQNWWGLTTPDGGEIVTLDD